VEAPDRHHGGLERIDVAPAEWRSWSNPFARPPQNLAIEFENVRILDCQSCSACQSTLLLFLKRYGDRLFDYFPEDQPLVIAIGKGHEDLPPGTLCIGNCTAKFKEGRPFVPGCPPVVIEILNVYNEYFKS
jgi:hypothetical protein